LLLFDHNRLRIGAGMRSMDRATGDGGRSLTSRREMIPVLADDRPATSRM
jgi:hypothetical protein